MPAAAFFEACFMYYVLYIAYSTRTYEKSRKYRLIASLYRIPSLHITKSSKEEILIITNFCSEIFKLKKNQKYNFREIFEMN